MTTYNKNGDIMACYMCGFPSIVRVKDTNIFLCEICVYENENKLKKIIEENKMNKKEKNKN